MNTEPFLFPSGNVDYHFDSSIAELPLIAAPDTSVIITDDNVAAAHAGKWAGYRHLSIAPGEGSKTIETVQHLANELVALEAHRGTTLIGIGGGVVTDLTGFLATSYMRGLTFHFVPTTILAMVDAAIGGKNGVNSGLHKNMLGSFRQPKSVLFDAALLTTLPDAEWSNGFAEIIKYAFMADARLLTTLQANDVAHYQKHAEELSQLIQGCVDLKSRIVNADETETGIRKTLNFGHTAGHAFETLYGLPHGHAVGLGMKVAIALSEQHAGLMADSAPILNALLERYGLPTALESMDAPKVLEVLRMDKKRSADAVDYVLIEKPGVAIVKPLKVDAIAQGLSAAGTAA